MKVHELSVRSRKTKKRVGRGIGSGRGKTAGRGTKGQNARSGGGVRIGFEGGQNPLVKRLPKIRGFSKSRPKRTVLHTDQLNVFPSKSKVNKDTLFKQGLINSKTAPVKLLRRGKLKKSLEITIDAASRQASQAIEEAGGKVTVVTVRQK